MSDDKEKINIPEDFPGKGTGDGTSQESPQPEKNPAVENDPEVLAEKKKNLLWHLRLERWKEGAKTIGFLIQTFKAEAVSLMSGLGTLVLGWIQLRKWVLTGRKEIKSLENTAPPKPRNEAAHRVEVGHGSGSGYGSGHGRIGGSHRPGETLVAARDRVKPTPTSDHSVPTQGVPILPAPGEPLAMMPKPIEIPTMMTDPQTYVWFGLIGTFVWSSVVAWIKKRKKQLEEKGGK